MIVLVLAAAVVLSLAGFYGLEWRSAQTGGQAGASPLPTNSTPPDSGSTAASSDVPIVPAPSASPDTCANASGSDRYPKTMLPYGVEEPDLWGLNAGTVGTDQLCYSGSPDGSITNTANFSNIQGATGVLAYPHIEYGQSLWGGSPGTQAQGFVLPEPESEAVDQGLWLTNTYSVHDAGGAGYDYVWDNLLTSYRANQSNTGPGNFTLEVMLWMATGYEVSPWAYLPYGGSVSLPTLVNTTLSYQSWDFSYRCQGPANNELTVFFFYGGDDSAPNVTNRTLGVSFSSVLVVVDQMIEQDHESCWSYPANQDSPMYLDDLNLGAEYQQPQPAASPEAVSLDWTISSMCFRLPQGVPTVPAVSCPDASDASHFATTEAPSVSGSARGAPHLQDGVSGNDPTCLYARACGDGTVGPSARVARQLMERGSYPLGIEGSNTNDQPACMSPPR